MGRGGKRTNAGRKKGALTVKTQAIAAKAIATGQSPLDVMLDNMRHFQKVAADAEALLEGLSAEQITGQVLEPQEQFKVLLAEVKKAAGLRMLAQGCASDAARFCHPTLSPVEAGKRSDDEVPLVDRLKGYARTEAIESSKGKVVVLAKKARGG